MRNGKIQNFCLNGISSSARRLKITLARRDERKVDITVPLPVSLSPVPFEREERRNGKRCAPHSCSLCKRKTSESCASVVDLIKSYFNQTYIEMHYQKNLEE